MSDLQVPAVGSVWRDKHTGHIVEVEAVESGVVAFRRHFKHRSSGYQSSCSLRAFRLSVEPVETPKEAP